MQITAGNEPISKTANGYIIGYNGKRYAVNDTPGAWTVADVESYLASHPDALQPEPLPPPPTDAQLEAAAEAQRQALFAKYDDAVWIIEQQAKRGSITQAECDARLAPWYAFARALELVNDTEGWFRDTVWPEKPEA